DRFPDTTVTTLVAADPPRIVKHAPPDAHHLILTYSHEIDLALCHALLSHGFQSAGLIGSATKWARFRSRLAALGHEAAQISRITCPIGDPTLGKHPAEIALGVATGMIRAAQRQSENRTA
ncbi:MAG: XdhC family protein, partial [Pseudomonadota bacterium]